MKKFALSVLAFAMIAGNASAQKLTCVNNNTCSATVQFNVIGGDASTPCPPGPVVSIALSNGSSTASEDIYDFNASGAGPIYWSFSSVGAGAFWSLCQPSVTTPGFTGGAGISGPSFSCWSVPSTTTFTDSHGCTVTVSWTEDPLTHDVLLQAN